MKTRQSALKVLAMGLIFLVVGFFSTEAFSWGFAFGHRWELTGRAAHGTAKRRIASMRTSEARDGFLQSCVPKPVREIGFVRVGPDSAAAVFQAELSGFDLEQIHLGPLGNDDFAKSLSPDNLLELHS